MYIIVQCNLIGQCFCEDFFPAYTFDAFTYSHADEIDTSMVQLLSGNFLGRAKFVFSEVYSPLSNDTVKVNASFM